jgi:hypothetical protein
MDESYAEQFFKDCNGLVYVYPNGFWYKFEISAVRKTAARPAGYKYALAFFDERNECLVRYDNAHSPTRSASARRAGYDHWHRFGKGETVGYAFVDLATLVEDFFRDIEAHLPPELRSR